MRDGPVLATVTAAFAFLVVSMLADPWSAFLRERGFTARNFAGVELPVGMGLLLLFPLAAVASGPLAGVPGAALYLAVVLGFALTGLIDDAAEEPGVRGIRGHLRALLRQRRLTGGGVKLAAGILLALLAGASAPSLPERVADASLVALAANAWNALDVRPGRALKVYLAALPLAAGVVAGGTPLLPLWAALAGGAAALLKTDLSERGMLGDAGANALGASVGLLVAWAWPPPAALVALGAVLAFHVAVERGSLTAWIERHPLAARLDAWGRRSPGRNFEPGRQ